MKKLFLLVTMMTFVAMANAQEVLDHFVIGPYEVDYKGHGDVNYRLKKDVDVKKFFNIKNDTIVQTVQPETEPVEQGWQVGIIYTMPFYTEGKTNAFAIEGLWKKHLSGVMYFNAGLMLGFQSGEYANWKNMKETLLEAGVPLSLEFSNVDRKKSSLYGSIGVMTAFYSTMSAEDDSKEDLEKLSGFLVAPRLEIGAYVPVCGQLVRFGLCAQRNINCSNSGDKDSFALRSGDNYLGLNVGLVF